MTPNWQVGVRLTLLTSGFTGLAVIARQFNTVNMGAAQLQKRLNVIRGLAIGGALTMGFGLAIAGGMFKAANQAGDLALALKSVQIAGHFTNSEMLKLQAATFQVSNITARSAKEVAQWMAIVRNSSTFTAQQLAGIMPSIARFADVMFFTKNVPFEQSITLGARFSHLFQMYSPEALRKGLDMLASASRLVPGGPQQIMTSLAQSAAMGQTLGVLPSQMIALTALLDRLGMGGRGGTGLMNVLQYAVPNSAMLTGSRSNKQMEALAALGLLTKGPHGLMPVGMESGAFNAVEYFQALARSFTRFTGGKSGPGLGEARAAWMSLVHNAFNLRGARVADIMGALPASLQQLDIILKAFQNDFTVFQAQSKLLETWNVQWSRMTTNLENVFIRIMLPFVQGSGATALTRLGDFFGRLAESITPSKANAIVLVLGALATVMTGAGGLLLLSAALSGLALIAGPVGMVAAGIMAFTAAIIAFHRQIGQFFGGFVDALRKNFDPKTFQILTDSFKGLFRVFSSITGTNTANWKAFGEALGRIVGRGVTANVQTLTDIVNRLTWFMDTLGVAKKRWDLLWHGGGTGPAWPNFPAPVSNPTAPPAPTHRASGGFVNHGPITVNVHALTADPKKLAQRIATALDEMGRDHYRASGAGVLHPLIPVLPSMSYG